MTTRGRGRGIKFLSKDDILRAMDATKSNKAAARFSRCSFPHYRKYAEMYTDEATGKSLYELHKNPSGKGIPKYLKSKGKDASLEDIINGNLSVLSLEPAKIKQRLVFEGYLKEECNRCGFREERVFDRKIPLILQFKDKSRTNYSLDNIELMCYNCSYLYGASPITDEQARAAEDYVERKVPDIDWEIDDAMKEHLSSLGLWQEEPSAGSEYISENYKNRNK